ncbi:hypothetical protein PVK06_010298 [Gossypium arboreum]|uniref:Reverse transcriptase zinc-binding domain-containing protein n=1 Tax=Gossypium arboreum TaxID=29729 RepID=A0ABR0Q6G1_GOSAR|nr:hypothetical protein PVK06_010298 [Gossypium arboreum]
MGPSIRRYCSRVELKFCCPILYRARVLEVNKFNQNGSSLLDQVVCGTQLPIKGTGWEFFIADEVFNTGSGINLIVVLFLDCVQDNECSETWRLTGFYENPNKRSRNKSWELLLHLRHDQMLHWLVVGDFNKIMNSFEKKGGRLRSKRQCLNFETCWMIVGLMIWALLVGGSRGSKVDSCQLISKKDLIEEDPSNEVLAEITDIQLGLNLEIDKEELFWEQRARVNWLQYRDRNTNFFHKVAVQCHNQSRITGLEGENGCWFSMNEEMLQLTLKYFDNLFSASNTCDDEQLFGLVEKWITTSMNDELLKPFMEEDIARAIKSMISLKAPSVDANNYRDFYNLPCAMHIPAMPYSTNLFQRRLNVDVVCPFCKEAPEDSDHLMWSCGILQQLWASLNIMIAPSGITLNYKDQFVNTFHATDESNRQV